MSCPILSFTSSLNSPSPQNSPVVKAAHQFFSREGMLWIDLGFKSQEDGEQFMKNWNVGTTKLMPLSTEQRWGVRLSSHCKHLQKMFTALFSLHPELKPQFSEILEK